MKSGQKTQIRGRLGCVVPALIDSGLVLARNARTHVTEVKQIDVWVNYLNIIYFTYLDRDHPRRNLLEVLDVIGEFLTFLPSLLLFSLLQDLSMNLIFYNLFMAYFNP